jgi:hypothetical protein
VVVADLNVVRISVRPAKANPPLLVDPNAVLTGPITKEPLQPIPWWNPEVIQAICTVQQQQLPVGSPLHVRRQSPRPFALEYLTRLGVSEAPDHRPRVASPLVTSSVNIARAQPNKALQLTSASAAALSSAARCSLRSRGGWRHLAAGLGGLPSPVSGARS